VGQIFPYEGIIPSHQDGQFLADFYQEYTVVLNGTVEKCKK
jgi:hypothetical protein